MYCTYSFLISTFYDKHLEVILWFVDTYFFYTYKETHDSFSMQRHYSSTCLQNEPEIYSVMWSWNNGHYYVCKWIEEDREVIWLENIPEFPRILQLLLFIGSLKSVPYGVNHGVNPRALERKCRVDTSFGKNKVNPQSEEQWRAFLSSFWSGQSLFSTAPSE